MTLVIGRSREFEALHPFHVGGAGTVDTHGGWRLDPMNADRPDDEIVVTTKRRLLRLTTAASDVAARFAREGSDVDASDWMADRHPIFAGATGMEACQELDGFTKCVALHGFGLGLDVEAHDLDRFLDDEGGEHGTGGAAGSAATEVQARPVPPRSLFTCWLDVPDGGGGLLAFCALVTGGPVGLRERIAARYGAAAAAAAEIVKGFDADAPRAAATIGGDLIRMLRQAASDPLSPSARNLDVVIERRFPA